MSYTFLLEPGGESSVGSFLDIPQSVLLNLTPMQDKCYLQDKEMDCSLSFPFGMTLQPLMGNPGQEELMSSAGASPAKTSVQPAKEPELKEVAVVYGNTWRELSMKYDQDTSLLKTHLCLWEEVLPLSSVILPAWGMMQDGVFLELMTLGVITCARGAGYWPTPLKEEGPGSQQLKLTDAVAVAEGYKPRYHHIDGMEEREAFCGKVNPDWVEWLMGWPMGWTNALTELAMDKFQQWQQMHGGFYFDERKSIGKVEAVGCCPHDL